MCSSAISKFKTTIDQSNTRRTFLSYFCVWLWIGWISFYFFFTLSIPFLYIYAKPLFTSIIGLMIISGVSTISRNKQPKIAFKVGDWMLKNISVYFQSRFIVEDEDVLASCGPSIIALEPHDVLPLSIFAFNTVLKGLKGHNCLGCVTSACFQVPIMKHIYTWVNAVSVDKKTMIKALENGFSPVLCPGGVQEVTLMTDDSECVLYLKSRFGFIKLALAQGVPLIPAFTFGLRNSFSFWVPKDKFSKTVARKIGFLPMLFFGQFGILFAPAKPCTYTTVVGKPIIMPKIADPSEADLKKYHTIYIEELTRIYELFKEENNMGHVKLRIA